jgi:exodeoxyribonuclease VII small subunit
MSQTPAPDPPFEDALAELERVVRDLEDGQLGLDEALTRYERGVALVKQCRARIQQAEQRILLLTSVDPDGEPVLRPFEHEATAAAPRSRSRARGKGLLPEPEA